MTSQVAAIETQFWCLANSFFMDYVKDILDILGHIQLLADILTFHI